MKLTISNDEARLLLREAIGEKVKIRGVECTEGGMKVRVSLGVFPVSAEFQDIRLAADKLRVRVAGAVAPTLLNLVGKELNKGEIQVEGDELLVTLPRALCQAVQITALKVHPGGIDLEGKILNLSALRS